MTDGPIQRLMRRHMLTCRDVNEFLAAYLDDRLPDDLQGRFERHVGRCEHCTTYLEQYRTTTLLIREAGELPDDVPDALIESTLTFLRERRQSDDQESP